VNSTWGIDRYFVPHDCMRKSAHPHPSFFFFKKKKRMSYSLLQSMQEESILVRVVGVLYDLSCFLCDPVHALVFSGQDTRVTELMQLLRSVLCSSMANFLVGTSGYVGGVP